MSDANRPPIPKERWKGPPEGPPDYVRPLVRTPGPGCATSSLVIAGLALAIIGPGCLVLGLIVSGDTIGANLAILFSGLAAGICGLALTMAAGRQPAVSEQAEASSGGCLWAFMAVSGSLMLLPGLCSLLFGMGYLDSPISGAAFLSQIYADPFFVSCLLIGAIGVGMIRWVILRASPIAGIATVIGTVLLLMGLCFALFGASRSHSRALLVIGLPATVTGVLLLWRAAQRRPRNGTDNFDLDLAPRNHE